MSNALAVLGGFSFCANPGLSGSLHFGGFFFLRRCNGHNCFLSPKQSVSQFIPVLWGGNSRQKGGVARGFEGSSDTCVAGLPKACFAGLPEACGCRRFGAFFPCFGIKSGIKFYSIRYFKGFKGVYQLIANHLLIFFGVVWRAVFACCGLPVFACCGLPDGRRTAPLFLSPRQGGRGCEFAAAPFGNKWVCSRKNITKKGHFLRDLSKTHLAKSYLTASRCARPMRIVRRITSCLASSSLSDTSKSSFSSSSDMRIFCTIGSLFLSFMVKSIFKYYISANSKKVAFNTTKVLTVALDTTI